MTSSKTSCPQVMRSRAVTLQNKTEPFRTFEISIEYGKSLAMFLLAHSRVELFPQFHELITLQGEYRKRKRIVSPETREGNAPRARVSLVTCSQAGIDEPAFRSKLESDPEAWRTFLEDIGLSTRFQESVSLPDPSVWRRDVGEIGGMTGLCRKNIKGDESGYIKAVARMVSPPRLPVQVPCPLCPRSSSKCRASSTAWSRCCWTMLPSGGWS